MLLECSTINRPLSFPYFLFCAGPTLSRGFWLFLASMNDDPGDTGPPDTSAYEAPDMSTFPHLNLLNGSMNAYVRSLRVTQAGRDLILNPTYNNFCQHYDDHLPLPVSSISRPSEGILSDHDKGMLKGVGLTLIICFF